MSSWTSGGLSRFCSPLFVASFGMTQKPQAKWMRVEKIAKKSGIVETIWPGCKPKHRPVFWLPLSSHHLILDWR